MATKVKCPAVIRLEFSGKRPPVYIGARLGTGLKLTNIEEHRARGDGDCWSWVLSWDPILGSPSSSYDERVFLAHDNIDGVVRVIYSFD